jgi:type IV pilus assembly protein PilC
MEYVCHVGTAEGRVLRQVRRAPTEEALRAELEREGLELVALERRLGALPRVPQLALGRRRVPLQLLLVFSQELAALLRAGLPLLQALHLLVERQRDALFKSHLDQVYERVRSGAELSEAFAEFGDAFPPLFASSLKAGERTGELEQVLHRFGRYLKLVLDARRKVYTALVYPTLLVGLSLAMLGVMAVYVVPRFQVFYEAMDMTELPALTRLTLGTGQFLRANLLWIAAGSFFAWVALDRWSRTGPGRIAVARFRLALPVLGEIFHRFAISEYCRSLSTLLAGGLPLVQSLEIATQAVGNAWVRSQLEPAIPRVREGHALHRALEEVGVVPDLAIDMVEVGEATGALDQMLANVSVFLDEEVETRMARLLSLVEPILLLAVGGLVAVLLVSVYLPIFSALSQVQ